MLIVYNYTFDLWIGQSYGKKSSASFCQAKGMLGVTLQLKQFNPYHTWKFGKLLSVAVIICFYFKCLSFAYPRWQNPSRITAPFQYSGVNFTLESKQCSKGQRGGGGGEEEWGWEGGEARQAEEEDESLWNRGGIWKMCSNASNWGYCILLEICVR